MFFKKCYLLVLLAVSGLYATGQGTDTLVKKLDSLTKKADTAGQVNNINPANYNEYTKITPKVYFILLASDFKQQITAPFHLRGRQWLRLGEVAAGTALLTFADEPIQRFSTNLVNHNGNLGKVSSFVSNLGGAYEIFTLSGFAAYGFLFKSEKVKTTAFLASQAYITSAAISTILKHIGNRQRPTFYNPHQVEQEPTFRGPFASQGRNREGRIINGSFPSGHATAAFSAATVYAMEYRDRPVIPIVAYSAASLITLSRLTQNAHWLTDILAGTALGYLCGRQVVNNYHRYARLQNDKKKKAGMVLFNLQYNNGVLMPGLTYRFR